MSFPSRFNRSGSSSSRPPQPPSSCLEIFRWFDELDEVNEVATPKPCVVANTPTTTAEAAAATPGFRKNQGKPAKRKVGRQDTLFVEPLNYFQF